MKRQFLLNVILLMAINVLIKPFYVFFVETEVQNELGTAEFGYYFFHMNFVFLFQFLGDLGLQTHNQQYVSKNRTNIHHFFSSVIGLKLALTFLATVVLFVFGLIFGKMDIGLLLLISVNLFLSSWLVLMRSFLSGLGFYTLDSLVSSLDKFLMIIVISGLLWYGNDSSFTLSDFIFGQMFSLLFANIVVMVLLFIKDKKLSFLPDFTGLSSLLYRCIPFALVLFLMTSYNKLDGFLLGRLLEDQGLEAGIYAASYRIYDAANMFMYMIPALILPMFSYMISNNEDIRPLYTLVGKWMFVLLSPLLAIVLFFGNDIITFLYTDYITEKTLVLQLLMTASVLVCYAYIFGSMSMAADQIKRLIPVFILGLVVNILCNLIWIPHYGATGAAMATLVTQFVVFLGQWYVVRKYLYFTFDKSSMGRGLFYLFILSGLAWFFSKETPFSSEVSIIICLIFSLPLAFLLKLIEFSDIKLVLSRKK
jgi:O-antigen/teichoic acid export membrane protein